MVRNRLSPAAKGGVCAPTRHERSWSATTGRCSSPAGPAGDCRPRRSWSGWTMRGRWSSPPGRAPTRHATCDATRRRSYASCLMTSSAPGSRSRGRRRSCRCRRRWRGWSTTTGASAGSIPTGMTTAASCSTSTACSFASRSTRRARPRPLASPAAVVVGSAGGGLPARWRATASTCSGEIAPMRSSHR